MIGYMDIQAEEIQKHVKALQHKKGVCEVLPAGRYAFQNNRIEFAGLVCLPIDMGGYATGVGAEHCENCLDKWKRR